MLGEGGWGRAAGKQAGNVEKEKEKSLGGSWVVVRWEQRGGRRYRERKEGRTRTRSGR